MAGLQCSGNVRIAYVDGDGVPIGGFIGVINAVKLAINTPEPETKNRISKMNESYGQALDTLTIAKPTEVELSTDDTGDQEVLAWAVNGAPTNFQQAAAVVPAETFKAYKGQWVRLPHRAVTAVVVTDSTGTTTHAVGVDYLVDPAAGMVKITDAGAIVDASDIKIAYSAAALTGKRIAVGTRSSIQVCIDGDMRNLANGKTVHVHVRRAKLASTGGIDLAGNDFLVAALKGTAIQLPGFSPADITFFDA